MKKICIYFLAIIGFAIIIYGAAQARLSTEKQENAIPGVEFLNSVEKGTADAEAFTSAVKRWHFILGEISPPAVANYMEALANNGILDLIPIEYYKNEEINTALDVVFEDRANVIDNWDVFETQWLPTKICS
jgi:hypothetical protein